jgi:hypothetical protein
MIRIIKKWCDDNPSKTHQQLTEIFWEAFSSLD